MDEQAEFSVLSKASYDYFHGGEALANSELREYGLDYTIDSELSDSRAVVITRPDGSAVVSYRGTDHVSDLVPDFQIAMGYHSNPLYQRVGAVAAHVVNDRFADARDRYARAKKKHGSDVSVTGHSLGGSLALHTARAHGGKAVVFNPGSSPLAEPFHAAYCTAFDCGYAERARIYSTGRDPISLSSYIFDQATDDVVKVAPKDRGDYFAHGLVHFLPRRRTGVHPTYLDPVDTVGGGVVPFCVVFPELCPVGS
jgi:pimeloyl-ACP methyl ester carboxylesterase